MNDTNDYTNILLQGFAEYSDCLTTYYWNAYKESHQEKTLFFTGLRKALEAIDGRLTATWAYHCAHWISEKPKREDTRMPFPMYGVHIGVDSINMMAEALLIVMKRAKDEDAKLSPDKYSLAKSANKPKIEAPTIAQVCRIANEIEAVKKGESEKIEDFCKRVCTALSLNYTDNVRKNFSNKDSRKLKEKVKDQILPILEDQSVKNKFEAYLNGNLAVNA